MGENCCSRRQILEQAGMGMGLLGLHALFGAAAADEEKKPNSIGRTPQFKAKAKHIIHIFAEGGPTHLDTWDPKPELTRNDGKQIWDGGNPAFGSPYKFKKHGKSGIEVSELFPKLAEHVDDMTVIRSLWTDVPVHPVAQRFLFTGSVSLPRPSMGSWVVYGLGSGNRNLPAFITLGGGEDWRQASFLPGETQGVNVNFSPGMAPDQVMMDIRNPFIPAEQQRRQLDLARSLDAMHAKSAGRDPQLDARIESFETAFRMQSEAPEAFNLEKESEATLKLYGRSGYGASLLAARRLIERGVRVVQVNQPGWDHHANLARSLPGTCESIDGPAAALLTDLKQRGLLDETLVVWCGEFGRSAENESKSAADAGRNHNAAAGVCWMAGGGVKRGFVYGKTDEFGEKAVENRVHTHDLQATILALMGFDHEKLTYRYNGRDFRLTDNYGAIVRGIIA